MRRKVCCMLLVQLVGIFQAEATSRHCYSCVSRRPADPNCETNVSNNTVAVTNCTPNTPECITHITNTTVIRRCGVVNYCSGQANLAGFLTCSACSQDYCNDMPVTVVGPGSNARFCYSCEVRRGLKSACEINVRNETVSVTNCSSVGDPEQAECITLVTNTTVHRRCEATGYCSGALQQATTLKCSSCSLNLCNYAAINLPTSAPVRPSGSSATSFFLSSVGLVTRSILIFVTRSLL